MGESYTILMRLRFHFGENEAKYFRPHQRFRFVFTSPHWFLFIRKRLLFDTFSPVVDIKKRPKTPDGIDSVWRFFRHRFRKPPFSSEFPIGRFSLDDRRNCNKKFAFSYESALLWSGTSRHDERLLQLCTLLKTKAALILQSMTWPAPSWLDTWTHGQFPWWNVPAGSHGSCIHANKYPNK